ncbi:DUF1615 family protein [Shigella flexneri]
MPYITQPLTFLPPFVLAGCAEKGAARSKREDPVHVASVVRQKMPASVKDRSAWAEALATTFKSQKSRPRGEYLLVLAVAQRIDVSVDPVVPGLNKIARKGSTAGPSDAYPGFRVHTALKSPRRNGKGSPTAGYSEKPSNSSAPFSMISSIWCRWARSCLAG